MGASAPFFVSDAHTFQENDMDEISVLVFIAGALVGALWAGVWNNRKLAHQVVRLSGYRAAAVFIMENGATVPHAVLTTRLREMPMSAQMGFYDFMRDVAKANCVVMPVPKKGGVE
jgi:hypothetical protein